MATIIIPVRERREREEVETHNMFGCTAVHTRSAKVEIQDQKYQKRHGLNHHLSNLVYPSYLDAVNP
jgi:hypothetical protein